jgi:hypothetical protein
VAIWLLLTLAACNDPNSIGLQEYGTIYGTVLNVKTNQAIGGALVSAAGYIARTDPKGGFQLRVPIGSQSVTVIAPGFKTATVDISVLKNQSSPISSPVPYLMLSPSVDAPGASAPVQYTPVPVSSPTPGGVIPPRPVPSASP